MSANDEEPGRLRNSPAGTKTHKRQVEQASWRPSGHMEGSRSQRFGACRPGFAALAETAEWEETFHPICSGRYGSAVPSITFCVVA